MKGVMAFLEKTGFVSRQESEADSTVFASAEPAELAVPVPPLETTAPVDPQVALTLPQIYEMAGVPPSNFPAERLLRLLDGLKMMDEATRRVAVTAMDAADDSWTIEDPIRDAALKVQVLVNHGMALRQGVEQAEAETTAQIAAVKDREAATVTDIKRQIAELEGLLAREVTRSTQEQADLQAALAGKRETVNHQIEQLNAVATDFKRLVAQFGAVSQPLSSSAAA